MNGMTRSTTSGESKGAVFQWPGMGGGSRYYEYAIIPSQKDFSDNEYLTFRAAQMPRHPNTTARLEDQNFRVVLKDGTGHESGLMIGAYGAGILEPYQRRGSEGRRPGVASSVLDCYCVGGGICCKKTAVPSPICDMEPQLNGESSSDINSPCTCDYTTTGTGWQAEFGTVRIRLTDFLNGGSGLDLGNIVAVRFEFAGDSGSSPGRIALDDVEVTALPPCPAVIPCNGQSCVKGGTPLGDTDTGLSACQPASGTAINCGGGRVHIVTYGCNKGSCCTTPPYCFCPNECPSGSYLECH
jgi:hypothetical protein